MRRLKDLAGRDARRLDSLCSLARTRREGAVSVHDYPIDLCPIHLFIHQCLVWSVRVNK